MKAFPSRFVFEQEKVLKVVYCGSQEHPTPYFYAPSIEELLGVNNPAASASSRMKALESRIINYNQQNGVEFVSHPVQLLGSSKPAWMHLSDGLYEILAVKTSNNLRARTTYYYNQASVFYVINTAKTDIANVIQHWINGEVLTSIAKTDAYLHYRKDGIGIRKQLTDTIKNKIEVKQLTDSAYMDITDAIYVIRYGLHAPQLRARLGLKDGENIREHLSQEELQALARLESELSGLLNFGHSIEETLSNPDFIKAHSKPL